MTPTCQPSQLRGRLHVAWSDPKHVACIPHLAQVRTIPAIETLQVNTDLC